MEWLANWGPAAPVIGVLLSLAVFIHAVLTAESKFKKWVREVIRPVTDGQIKAHHESCAVHADIRALRSEVREIRALFTT